ncbi:aminoacyl-tRNA deacylase [Sulfobacillus harzensis]|uniref:Cys-tRNA(Pro)/Cys-tRNA(Cys) deacylase n=1 Tax=Sulfobacillus harzensis TaxID=2729629 RepID=A0A7Y0L6N2_9FIRM|nr:aminoacyl-tRNA deacylase [Sulfobacillus harzensis]NMP24013.1 aminoacyl-tRNA deacylase [Sulfobacillus harzensis]
MAKTLAMRALEALEIFYRVRTYEVDENNLDAVHTAELVGVDPERLYKTLVAKGASGTILMAVIPGPATLDLKRWARVAEEKRVDLVPWRDLPNVTGYVRGGVSPLGAKRTFPVYLQQGVETLDEVSVSAGKRGVQMILSGADLVRATGGLLCDIIQSSP